MRIFLLANNFVGLEICKYLVEKKENIIALAVHEKDKQKFTKDIIEISKVGKKNVFLANSLREQKTLNKIKKLKPDIIIAAFWGYILRPDLISIPPRGCINFHPGYLPFNRGVNPNVWPFIENTPIGVTLHYIDAGTDTGDIIARKKIELNPIDTAGTAYDKTLEEIVALFKKTWPLIKTGKNKRIQQSKLGKSTTHKIKDLEKVDELDLNKSYKAKTFINLLRSRSYKDRFYMYFKEKNRKVYIRVDLSYEK